MSVIAAVNLEVLSGASPVKPALSEEEMERLSKSIIDEFLHINDYKVCNIISKDQGEDPFTCLMYYTKLNLPVQNDIDGEIICLMQEAVQCVEELEQPTMLYVFVRVGVESTLERSLIARDHMGQLLYQLLQPGILSKPQFFKG